MKWKRLVLSLALGIVPTAISYIMEWWWAGTIFALLTLLMVGLCIPLRFRNLFLNVYAVVTIAWISGAVIEGILLADWDADQRVKSMIGMIAGLTISVVPMLLFWLVVFQVSATWVLGISRGLDVTKSQARKFVTTRFLGLSQQYIVVRNAQILAENPPGMLSTFGGPGLLVIDVGNVVVLERAGTVTRILGPGIHTLERFEYIKRPFDGKGIMDLRPQFAGGVAEDVRTKDGIPLTIVVGEFFQLEPKQVTDQRPESHFAGGDATTPLLGAPEHPVYEAIIRKAVFNIPETGWKTGWFPSDPIHRLRDVVATYTLDEIFSFDKVGQQMAPDQRVIKEIEEKVRELFNPVEHGVWFKGMDIREIKMPKEVEERVLKKWTARVERELRVAEAEAERDAMIRLSEGRADSLAQLEGVRLRSRRGLVRAIQKLAEDLPPSEQNQVVLRCIDMFRELANRARQDETVLLRYIEAMQAIVRSEGPKSFIITPPTPGPGFMPSPPPPIPSSTQIVEEQLKGSQEQKAET